MAKSKAVKKLILPLNDELKEIDSDLFNEQISWETPDYIYNNLQHNFRYYQSTALRYFHYTQSIPTFNHRNINHVLFNMATGSGKTDLMAGLILYLYKEHNYQNFLFVVNTNGVLNKTIDNLTKPASDKYLYQDKIEIDGNRVEIKDVDIFPKVQEKNTIYIKLDTIHAITTDIYTQFENSMNEDEYAENKVVILGDEAHHFSAATKAKDKEKEQSWETTISKILHARQDNRLLEFTATIDLDNKDIYLKYKHKILYRYTLDTFIQDKYSKNVKRIQSSNTDIDNMLNAVLLSEYRRRYALEQYDIYLKPIIMFKSQRVIASNEAHEKFIELIDSLSVGNLLKFLDRQEHTITDENSETLRIAYQYYRERVESLSDIIRDIKREFAPNRIINANDNSQSGLLEKGPYEALNSLESPTNLYRIIFAVAKLTEGWDVLNLYDIVRLHDDPKVSGTKTTTTSEAQLIGRGARYYPLLLQGERSYKRRFEDDSISSLALETIHYHTINEPQYLKNLVNSLNEMNLPTGEDKKNPLLDIKVKNQFKNSDAWKYGKIFYNETIEVNDEYYSSLDKYGIDNKKDIVISYISTIQELGYNDEISKEDYSSSYNLPIKFDERYLNKVMDRITFYHFKNLKKYIPLLNSREEFWGSKWLNIYNRTVYVAVPRTMSSEMITPKEKIDLIESYFIEISKKIKAGYSKKRGTGKFIGYPIKDYITNYRKRIPNYDTSKMVLVGDPQNVNRYEIKDDYFVYDSAIINLTERQLIDKIEERISELKEKYDEVYLIRMDENMHRESSKNQNLKLHQFGDVSKGTNLAGFQPDFILYLDNADYFIQIFIEPKGINIEEEQWKEDLLMYINDHENELLFEDETELVKIKGLKFYTMNDKRHAINQLGEIALNKDFKGLSL